MKRSVQLGLIGLFALAFLAANLVFFSIDATEAVIITQFGNPVRVISEPGLSVKLPDPVQSITRVNMQLQVFNLPQTEFLTSDKKTSSPKPMRPGKWPTHCCF